MYGYSFTGIRCPWGGVLGFGDMGLESSKEAGSTTGTHNKRRLKDSRSVKPKHRDIGETGERSSRFKKRVNTSFIRKLLGLKRTVSPPNDLQEAMRRNEEAAQKARKSLDELAESKQKLKRNLEKMQASLEKEVKEKF